MRPILTAAQNARKMQIKLKVGFKMAKNRQKAKSVRILLSNSMNMICKIDLKPIGPKPRICTWEPEVLSIHVNENYWL